MKKNILILLIGIIISLSICTFIIFFIGKHDNNEIPNNYIAVFKGETAEVVNTTYIYEKKKGKKKTYKYINTIGKSTGYDSAEWNEEIVKKGKVKKKKKVFEIAEKNNAYSYVKYIKDNKIYSIEEFKKVF